MKIPSLIAAESALAEVEATIAPLRAGLSDLLAQVKRIEGEIDAALAPALARLNAAKEEQARTLTRWVMHDDWCCNRYVLHPDERKTNPTWDGRAWLRKMCWDADTPRSRWRWTLDAGGNRTIIDPREYDPGAPAPTIKAMQAAADVHLVAVGYILTDMDNA